ncbi:MAG: hypothetical protein D6832_06975 [Alphaproteobacteria bacterium]|nr:MAG: hypothetical protein D6832_06975 [Alphaproteobacteria bacterium]
MRALEAAILAAHGRGDDAALARLYAEGAEAVLGTNEDAGAFLLTQAYVFALRAGDEAAARRCHARLVALGREA